MSDEDLEFSDLGRDPRFPRGWYILPAAVLGLIFWGTVLYLALT